MVRNVSKDIRVVALSIATTHDCLAWGMMDELAGLQYWPIYWRVQDAVLNRRWAALWGRESEGEW